MIRTAAGMVAGGAVGWCAGFLVMLFRGGMDIADITAVFYPIGGAFVGVVAGGLIASA